MSPTTRRSILGGLLALPLLPVAAVARKLLPDPEPEFLAYPGVVSFEMPGSLEGVPDSEIRVWVDGKPYDNFVVEDAGGGALRVDLTKPDGEHEEFFAVGTAIIKR